MKFEVIIKTILIFSIVSLIFVPGLKGMENYSSDQDIEILESPTKLDDYDSYRFCYIESGDVNLDHFSFFRIGLFWPAPPGFGLGQVGVVLKGWRGDTRLTVKSIYGTTTYDYDIHVYVRGFVGYAWPTVSIYGGMLKGCAFIAVVSPLN